MNWTCGIRACKESKMTQRIWAQGKGKPELLFAKMEKITGEGSLKGNTADVIFELVLEMLVRQQMHSKTFLVYSFAKQILVEHLLCAEHCTYRGKEK